MNNQLILYDETKPMVYNNKIQILMQKQTYDYHKKKTHDMIAFNLNNLHKIKLMNDMYHNDLLIDIFIGAVNKQVEHTKELIILSYPCETISLKTIEQIIKFAIFCKNSKLFFGDTNKKHISRLTNILNHDDEYTIFEIITTFDVMVTLKKEIYSHDLFDYFWNEDMHNLNGIHHMYDNITRSYFLDSLKHMDIYNCEEFKTKLVLSDFNYFKYLDKKSNDMTLKINICNNEIKNNFPNIQKYDTYNFTINGCEEFNIISNALKTTKICMFFSRNMKSSLSMLHMILSSQYFDDISYIMDAFKNTPKMMIDFMKGFNIFTKNINIITKNQKIFRFIRKEKKYL